MHRDKGKLCHLALTFFVYGGGGIQNNLMSLGVRKKMSQTKEIPPVLLKTNINCSEYEPWSSCEIMSMHYWPKQDYCN